MIYLVDTNVISEQRKAAPDASVTAWFARTEPDETRISVITVGEIRRGISLLELRRDHQQAARYETWLSTTIREFGERIVPVTTDAAQRWGHQDARWAMPTADGLIGATAGAHGWTLVTRNTKDFEHVGVPLLNPFTA